MPKRQRLSRADFSSINVAQSGRFYGTYFSLSVSSRSKDVMSAESKFSCVVSKKAAKKAVDRNGIKRRCREAVRKTTKSTGEHTAPFSFVFYAKKEAMKVSYAEIEKDVRQLLTQVSSRAAAARPSAPKSK